jgi:hypothetical protein
MIAEELGSNAAFPISLSRVILLILCYHVVGLLAVGQFGSCLSSSLLRSILLKLESINYCGVVC